MSDIQEEMKRLYMKAVEKDLEKSSANNIVVGRIIKLEEKNKELQNRINKAIIYMQNYINVEDSIMCENAREEFKEIINILQDKE